MLILYGNKTRFEYLDPEIKEHCNELLLRALFVLESETGTFDLKSCFAVFDNLAGLFCHFAVLLA